jgi:hypothetical protein
VSEFSRGLLRGADPAISGRVRTVTNRLVHAYGIAFGAGGIAWVGEGPCYTFENNKEEEIPARLASITTTSGYVRQYPARRRCTVADLIGIDRAFATEALEDYRPFAKESDNSSCEGRVVLGHITIRHRHRRGPLIVVSQAPRAGTLTEGYLRVNLELEPVPEVPGSCHAPAFYPVLCADQVLLSGESPRAVVVSPPKPTTGASLPTSASASSVTRKLRKDACPGASAQQSDGHAGRVSKAAHETPLVLALKAMTAERPEERSWRR